MNGPPLIFESSEQLAQNLFSVFVIEERPTLLIERDFSASATFDQRSYERQKFIYLVAIIAVAFTDLANKNKRFADALWHLRRMVRVEMHNRWGDTEDAADSAIEEAAQDCVRLIASVLSGDHAFSNFTWFQEWLKRSGVDEFNPVTLFLISHQWTEQYLALMNITERARITGG